MCYVDLEEAYDRVPQEIFLGGAVGVLGRGVRSIPRAIRSLYTKSMFGLIPGRGWPPPGLRLGWDEDLHL